MSDGCKVVIGAGAAKSIRRLPKQSQKAVLSALKSLEGDPRGGKPLTGDLGGIWSLRRGDYRVLYRLDDRSRRIEIARVSHRRDVYRRRP